MTLSIFSPVSQWVGLSLITIITLEIILRGLDNIVFGKIGGLLNGKLALNDMKLVCENQFFDENAANLYLQEAAFAFANRGWWPFVYWKLKAMNSEYINIDKYGHRVTWAAKSSKNSPGKTINIFTFGGSTIWGWGAKDDQTIPSLMAKALHKNTTESINITNFGQPGYVSMQDIITLIQALQTHHKPDYVVFYHGINDVFSALQNGKPGLSQNEGNRKLQFEQKSLTQRATELLKELKITQILNHYLQKNATLENIYSNLGESRLEAIIQALTEYYEMNMAIIHALSQEFNFKALFYWQPTLATKPHLSNVEKNLILSDFDKQTYIMATHEIAQRFKSFSNFHDISRLFYHTDNTVFVDAWHTNQLGNQIIANHISKNILESLNLSKIPGEVVC